MKGSYRHIVCVLTGTHDQEEVINQALRLASKHQAALSVLLTLDALPPNAQMIMQSASYLESTEEIESMAQRWLNQQAATWHTSSTVNTFVRTGHQTTCIIDLVNEQKADLVLKQADDDILDRWFGNDDIHLLRECPCPVWITHKDFPNDDKTVIAAVDLNYHYSPDVVARKRALNMEILRHATRIALVEFAQLNIVHIYEVVPESILRDGFIQIDQPALSEEKAMIADERQDSLDELMAMLSAEIEEETMMFLKPKTKLIEGDASRQLVKFVEEIDASLLVMGTAGRKGLSGLLLGNTAESVVHQINCALITVKTTI